MHIFFFGVRSNIFAVKKYVCLQLNMQPYLTVDQHVTSPNNMERHISCRSSGLHVLFTDEMSNSTLQYVARCITLTVRKIFHCRRMRLQYLHDGRLYNDVTIPSKTGYFAGNHYFCDTSVKFLWRARYARKWMKWWMLISSLVPMPAADESLF